MADEIAEREQHRRQDQDHRCQPAGETVHLFDQRRGQHADVAQHSADPADFRGEPGRHHHPAPGAADNRGAAERHRPAVAKRGVRFNRDGAFVDRHRFPGQDRLPGPARPARTDQAQIGRHPVAGLQQHDIAPHEVFGRETCPLPATQHIGPRRQHRPDRRHRVLGPAFLDEPDDGIDHDDREDDPGIDPVLQQRRHHRRRDEGVDQHVVEMFQKPKHRMHAAGTRQGIGSVRREALRGLCLGQPAGAGRQHRQHGFRWAGVRLLRGLAPGQGFDHFRHAGVPSWWARAPQSNPIARASPLKSCRNSWVQSGQSPPPSRAQGTKRGFGKCPSRRSPSTSPRNTGQAVHERCRILPVGPTDTGSRTGGPLA